MGLKITELSKAVEKLQDKGLVAWKTDREAGRTYVELSSKAVELMAEERDFMKQSLCPPAHESRATTSCAVLWTSVQKVTAVLQEEREKNS
ncbi:MAG: hypothetical protein ACLS34_06965 [Faecalibacterium sp.]